MIHSRYLSALFHSPEQSYKTETLETATAGNPAGWRSYGPQLPPLSVFVADPCTICFCSSNDNQPAVTSLFVVQCKFDDLHLSAHNCL